MACKPPSPSARPKSANPANASIFASNHWNITHTARQLDISPTTLRKKTMDYALTQPQ